MSAPVQVSHWAARIRAAWQSSFDGIMECGRLLVEAKEQLDHGQWLQLIDSQLPFKANTAQRLMKIATDERLTNAAHAPFLPRSRETLYELTKLPTDVFEQKIADGTIHPDMQRSDITGAVKKDTRAIREKVLAGLQSALPIKKYGVILADPEWRFEPYSRDTGMDRAADNHYPTSTTDAICARPVADIAADDCVLFLWATVPMLPDAFYVMEAWGFARLDTPRVGALETLLRAAMESHEAAEGVPLNPAHWCSRARALLEEEPQGRYVSNFAWAKNRIGNGYWNRNKHEHLLIGVRGRPPAPAMGTQWESLLEAAVGEHSAKPEKFYELIESYFPNLPKIELNARHARPGWDSWGYEAPETVTQNESSVIELDPIALNTVIGKHGETSGGVHDAPPDDQDGGASNSFDYPELPEFLRRKRDAA
jgi:N6-adenosine-specific RNA methylase IME4